MQVLNKLTEILKEITQKDLPTDPDEQSAMSLNGDIGIDSLDFINFLFRVEKAFDIKIPEEDIDNNDLVILGNLASYITDHKGR